MEWLLDRFVSILIKTVLRKGCDDGGLFGKVRTYYCMTETHFAFAWFGLASWRTINNEYSIALSFSKCSICGTQGEFGDFQKSPSLFVDSAVALNDSIVSTAFPIARSFSKCSICGTQGEFGDFQKSPFKQNRPDYRPMKLNLLVCKCCSTKWSPQLLMRQRNASNQYIESSRVEDHEQLLLHLSSKSYRKQSQDPFVTMPTLVTLLGSRQRGD